MIAPESAATTHFGVGTGASRVPRCGQVNVSGRGYANTRYSTDPERVTCDKCLAAMRQVPIPHRTPQAIATAEFAKYFDFMQRAAARGDANISATVKAALATLKMEPPERETAKASMLDLVASTHQVPPPTGRPLALRNVLLQLATDATRALCDATGADRFELQRISGGFLEAAECQLTGVRHEGSGLRGPQGRQDGALRRALSRGPLGVGCHRPEL